MARRKLIAIPAALLVIAAVAVAGGILYLRNVKPDYDDGAATNGVRSPVEIWHDSAAVPHIWAQSEPDLLFAQGYAHAQERLWQMELFRRVAEGRLSEVFGASLIETDKFLRTIGLWRAAQLNEARLDPAFRTLLDAYVAGVNYWIDTHAGPLPPEFLVLRIEPEHWRVRNSLAIEKIMALDLSLYESAASLTNALHALGGERAKYVVPREPAWGPTIVDAPMVPALPPHAAALLDALSITRASNAWVIGGARTRSGKPILANDMHLALRQPGVWYLMALHAPGIDVAGMTLPGVPYVIAGHTRAVAWGFTNVMLDDVDFFDERVDPRDSTHYLTTSGWQTFTTWIETVRVKGRSEPVEFSVRATRHGPVVSGVERRLRGQGVIAMQWAALDSSHSLIAFPRFNRARSADEFLAAIPFFDNPHQNVVYADSGGHFGYQMGGRVPLRGARKPPPILPVPGWTGEWDWTGYLPYAEHPRVANPAAGFVVTANNRQVRSAVGDLISNDWDLPYRAMRIREMILATPKHDAASVHRMQLDVTDLMAIRYKGAAVKAARAAHLDQTAREIENWNGVASAGSAAAAQFYAWYECLRKYATRSLFGQAPGIISRNALNAALDSGTLGWAGARGPALLDSLSTAAMLAADSVGRGKTWGDLHHVEIRHELGSAVVLDRLLDLSLGPAPHGGSPTTVNVSQYGAQRFPIIASYGPSERHVVDMADIDGAGGFILPSGESGLPGSRHYDDMFARWRTGGLWRIPLDRAQAEARAVHKMTLRPAVANR